MKIVIDSVEFAYAGKKILHGIESTINPGTFVAILGPNGAGKSTLLKCMNGLLKPQKGMVTCGGNDVQVQAKKELARQMAYVSQVPVHSFPLSVFEMVLLGRRPHLAWNNRKDDYYEVLDALQMMQIEHLALKNFNHISGGEQQKVVIARAIAQATKVMLLDEATSNLDIRHQLEVMTVVEKLVTRSGKTVIMIMHDLNIAARYADEIIIMSEGRICVHGKPLEVLTTERIASVYGVDVEVKNIDSKPHIIPLQVCST
jgi:iron complex transport system ATP-binding protein